MKFSFFFHDFNKMNNYNLFFFFDTFGHDLWFSNAEDLDTGVVSDDYLELY